MDQSGTLEVDKTVQKLGQPPHACGDINLIGDNADLDNVTEAEIDSNFKSYRPYIESCVKTIDLLVFFKPFTMNQIKTLYKKIKSDPLEATRQAFDIIINLKNTPNKFHHLLYALKEAEYPKIVQLLQGILIPVHNNHREKLKIFAQDIYHRLSVIDILPYLLTKNVLNQHDVDEIKSTEKYESRESAVIQLLSALPNRNKDWYRYFLWALLESEQRELAVLIDHETCEKIEKATLLRISETTTKSSLRSVDDMTNLRRPFWEGITLKHKINEQGENQFTPNIGEAMSYTLENTTTESKEIRIKHSNNKHRKFQISMESETLSFSLGNTCLESNEPEGKISDSSSSAEYEIIAYQNTETDVLSHSLENTCMESKEPNETMSDHTSSNEHEFVSNLNTTSEKEEHTVSFFKCNPCKREDCVETAMVFCPICCEYLCQFCERVHKKLRMTQSHHILPIKTQIMLQHEEDDWLLCDCQSKNETSFFCKTHKDFVCGDCQSRDHGKCDTVLIKNQENITADEINIEEKIKLLNDRLRELDINDRENEQKKLHLSSETAIRSVTSFTTALHRCINRLEDKAIQVVCQQEETQKMYIYGCRETCRLMQQLLDTKLAYLVKNMETGDKFKILVTNFKISKLLKKAEKVILRMENALYLDSIKFENNQRIIQLLTNNDLGRIKFEASGKNDQKESFNDIDLEEEDEFLDNMDLGQSLGIETAFLKPYFQFIQESSHKEPLKKWKIIANK